MYNLAIFRYILVVVNRKVVVIISGLFTGNNYVTMATNVFNFIVHLFTNDSWVSATLDVKVSQI